MITNLSHLQSRASSRAPGKYIEFQKQTIIVLYKRMNPALVILR